MDDGQQPRVVFGAGVSATALPGELSRLGGGRVMVITTVRAGFPEAIRQSVVATFTGVRPHVPVEVAQAARALADDAGADLLLAIGGGSVIGTAKAVALTSDRPIIAVPTTYAGSEMTPVWGLTENGHKRTGTDPRVRPRTVLYDPDLTMSLPLGESMASGVNALAHAVDAYWAPHTSSGSTARAGEAIRVLAAGLDALRAVSPAEDARSVTLRGAMLAGAVFAEAGSGLHHKICHVLGGRYDLPHAQTHAVILPHVLAFNAPAAGPAAAAIAAALGTDGDATAALVRRLARWGVPTRLSDLGFDPAQIPAAAEAIMPSVPPSNPRPVRRVDLVELLTGAYHGVVAGVAR